MVKILAVVVSTVLALAAVAGAEMQSSQTHSAAECPLLEGKFKCTGNLEEFGFGGSEQVVIKQKTSSEGVSYWLPADDTSEDDEPIVADGKMKSQALPKLGLLMEHETSCAKGTLVILINLALLVENDQVLPLAAISQVYTVTNGGFTVTQKSREVLSTLFDGEITVTTARLSCDRVTAL